MQDLADRLERLYNEAAECQLISDLSTNLGKRELFAKMAQTMRMLAAEIEALIESQKPT